VADAFRDLPNVGTVYAYDGSVGFGFPSLRGKEAAREDYEPRLSRVQEGFRKVYAKKKDKWFEKKIFFRDKDGLMRYDS